MKCDVCKDVDVTDGVNGSVNGPPPWSNEIVACCHGCENKAMGEIEKNCNGYEKMMWEQLEKP